MRLSDPREGLLSLSKWVPFLLLLRIRILSPNRTYNYRKHHLVCMRFTKNVMSRLLPTRKCYLICGRERGSPVISVPPLPQYICLDGSMRTWPLETGMTLQYDPRNGYSCTTDENVKGCKNILVSGRIIRKREWTVIG